MYIAESPVYRTRYKTVKKFVDVVCIVALELVGAVGLAQL